MHPVLEIFPEICPLFPEHGIFIDFSWRDAGVICSQEWTCHADIGLSLVRGAHMSGMRVFHPHRCARLVVGLGSRRGFIWFAIV
jgi:hypothetical protein